MVVYRKENNNLDPITGNTAAQSIEDTSNEGEKTANTASLMVPRAILTSRPNSHPFQERHIILDQVIKIGRSVARCRPAPNNAIFDCKVLSRNHAVLWYENGKFYLQDTKSSNGTFVNNQRLSKSSEESLPWEVCSGDILQFGVDVMENCRKVVHGCVVATLRLYLHDGKEAKASPTTNVVPLAPEASVSSQELYQLSQYLQEALHREQVLESKLGTLQKVVANTQDESDIGWKALIEEDRLLSRIETLESQLQTCGKNVTEEKLREDVMKLQEEKDKYQNAAKESLKKVLQEKLEAIQKVQDIESSLSNAESECTYLREVNKNNEQEMQYLLEKSGDNEKEMSELTKKLQETEEKYQELINQSADDKIDIENRVEEMKKNEESLAAKIEALEAENDFSKEQLESVKARFDLYKKAQQPEEKIEKNGLLSPCEDELEMSDKETAEKKTLIQKLSSEVNRLELELQRVVEENNKNEDPLAIKYEEHVGLHTNGDIKPSDSINQLKVEIQQLTNENVELQMSEKVLNCTVTLLKELLNEVRENKKAIEAELVYTQSQLDEAQHNSKKVHDEVSSLQQQLELARQHLEDKTEQVFKLESKVNMLENEGKDEDEDEKSKQNGIDSIPGKAELDFIHEQLQSTQQLLKESQNEAEQFKKKFSDLSGEMDRTKLDNKTITEFESLREECARHLSRIQVLESEVRKYRNENTRLDADNRCLSEKCEMLESAKLALENKSDDYWKQQISAARSEASDTKEQLTQALKEIVLIKERFAECTEEKLFVEKERDSMKEQLQLISMRSRTSYACCAIPVFVLLLATLMAFYPSLAHLTATSDQT